MSSSSATVAEPSSTVGGERLSPGPLAAPEADRPKRQPPAAAVAAALANAATSALSVHLASSERRAEEIALALRGFAPKAEVILLPPWDCLPYDRASPSRDVMARRMAVLAAVSLKATSPRIIVVSPEALGQRLPPADVVSSARFKITVGATLNRHALAAFAAAVGYVADDRIDEPGEIALLGEVIDVFPGDSERPVRIVLGPEDAVTALKVYDPLSQRSIGEIKQLDLGPASEFVAPREIDATVDPLAQARAPGVEHGLAAHYGQLPSLFDLALKATLSKDDKADERLARFVAQVDEAYVARKTFDLDAPATPSGLYLDLGELEGGLAAWRLRDLPLEAVEPVPLLARSRNPGGAFCKLVATRQAEGQRVVICGRPHELKSLSRALQRGLGQQPTPIGDWQPRKPLRPAPCSRSGRISTLGSPTTR